MSAPHHNNNACPSSRDAMGSANLLNSPSLIAGFLSCSCYIGFPGEFPRYTSTRIAPHAVLPFHLLASTVTIAVDHRLSSEQHGRSVDLSEGDLLSAPLSFSAHLLTGILPRRCRCHRRNRIETSMTSRGYGRKGMPRDKHVTTPALPVAVIYRTPGWSKEILQ